MKGVRVKGIGAVSPAGWSVNALRDALAKNEPLPPKALAGPDSSRALRVRVVPPLSPRPAFLTHGRLRRSSPATQFAASAALEAIGDDLPGICDGSLRLGIILCVMAGCVNYSRRFYEESLRDPRTASPLVFPETVFNAPASHLAALLGSAASSYTFVGDQGMFLAGLATGADWLRAGQVDACLVISTEELDWMVAGAHRRFARNTIVSEGAGALYLCPSSGQPGVELAAITDAHSFVQDRSRAEAVRSMRAELPASCPDHLLCDGLCGIPGPDRLELAAWADWTGARLSPKFVLGEGLAAASAWQCVAAVDALGERRFAAATVSVAGSNQQAIGAQFIRKSR